MDDDHEAWLETEARATKLAEKIEKFFEDNIMELPHKFAVYEGQRIGSMHSVYHAHCATGIYDSLKKWLAIQKLK